MATSVLQPENRQSYDIKSDIPDDNPSEKQPIDLGELLALEEDERRTGNLPSELLERAKNELREEPAIREHALKQMRHFIEKHPAIRKCRTDTPFLLRFLRTKKFSVPQACAMLERYLTIRQQHPQWFQKLDPLDPKLAAVIEAGYLVPLPKRDSLGRRVILSCAGRFDPYVHDSCAMARVHSMICEAFLDEPRSQLLGYTHVNDEQGLAMPHVSMWSLSDVRTMLGCIQNSTPMRHKQTHFLNIPHYGLRLIEFALSLLSDKLKNRVMVHRTIEELTQHVDASILPKEYGGAVPLSEMIQLLKERLLKRRDELLALDEMEIVLDAPSAGENDLTVGSFRALNLD